MIAKQQHTATCINNTSEPQPQVSLLLLASSSVVSTCFLTLRAQLSVLPEDLRPAQMYTYTPYHGNEPSSSCPPNAATTVSQAQPCPTDELLQSQLVTECTHKSAKQAMPRTRQSRPCSTELGRQDLMHTQAPRSFCSHRKVIAKLMEALADHSVAGHTLPAAARLCNAPI